MLRVKQSKLHAMSLANSFLCGNVDVCEELLNLGEFNFFASICCLNRLFSESIDLSGNLFTGSISFGFNLRNVRVLKLHSNQFSGSILSEIGDMTSLEELTLCNNKRLRSSECSTSCE